MDRLRERFLNVPLSTVLHPASSFALQSAKDQQTKAGKASAVQQHELTAQEWFEGGLARWYKDDTEGAVQDWTQAIRLQPGYAEAYYNRGNVRWYKGDLEGALQDYTEAIRFQPDHALAYDNRGIVRWYKGDLEGAAQDYQKYLDLGGRHA